MISFTLRCENGHRFDSWFASGAAYETLRAAGHVTCVDCGSAQVQKALMAPAVTTDRPTAPEKAPAKDIAPDASASKALPAEAPPSMAAGMPSLRALARLRRHVEETADYVGRDFARDVRAMNAGDAPERPIWGEVSAAEARDLIEDGLPVAPLPFGPRKKSN